MHATGLKVRDSGASTPARIPAAASMWTAARLGGASREVAVIAGGSHAVYLDVDGDAIALLARTAVHVPIGLRTGLPCLPGVGTAVVGEGELRLEPLLVRPARRIDPYVPRLSGLSGRGGAWSATLMASLPASVSAMLPAPALQSLAAGEAGAVDQLIGRGDGLTPLGDDVLAGWLVTRACAGLDLGAVADAVLAAADRTTTVSATLLRRALAAECVPQLRDLLFSVATGVGPEQLCCQLDELLAVGHTSGAGLALGAALALVPTHHRSTA